MLKVAVLRAEMERVKANMFVLGALTGADTGEESFRGLRSSFPQPELSEEGEEEAEEVSEEKEESEDVGEPDSESSPWIALSSSMDASWILNFPSMMTVPGPTVACNHSAKAEISNCILLRPSTQQKKTIVEEKLVGLCSVITLIRCQAHGQLVPSA